METAKPAPRFTALDEVGEGEEWSGDEEDEVEEVRSEISGYLHIIISILSTGDHTRHRLGERQLYLQKISL